jgi:hypothetical protein
MRVTKGRLAVAAVLSAARVPADSVPVPPPALVPAAGFLVIFLIAVISAVAVRHHRNHLSSSRKEALSS